METWERWRDAVEGEGARVHGGRGVQDVSALAWRAPGTWRSAADAAIALLPLMEEFRPDVVVSDILTLAPTLAAERAGREAGHADPPRVSGARAGAAVLRVRDAAAADTRLAGRCGAAALPVLESGLRRGRDEMNETRAAVGLPPVEGFHGGISRELAMVATFPQLEYPRRWPAGVHVTGPMQFELPYPDIELPEGDEPLVLVAPSTAQDPELRLVQTALEALADEPVRVVATTNRLGPGARAGGAGERGGRRLALLLAGDAARGAGGLPRRARDGGARAWRRAFPCCAARTSGTWRRTRRGWPGRARA